MAKATKVVVKTRKRTKKNGQSKGTARRKGR